MTHIESSMDEMVSNLKTKDVLFQTLFGDHHSKDINLVPAEQDKLDEIFKKEYPNYMFPLKVFHCQWVVDKINRELQEPVEQTEECRENIYDPGKRRYIRPQVLPTHKKRCKPKFDVGECIRTKRNEGDFYEIGLQDRVMVEELLEELSDDKIRNDKRADAALNSMAAIASVMNTSLAYKLVELHPERRIY